MLGHSNYLWTYLLASGAARVTSNLVRVCVCVCVCVGLARTRGPPCATGRAAAHRHSPRSACSHAPLQHLAGRWR
jgi:hypothetical protein